MKEIFENWDDQKIYPSKWRLTTELGHANDKAPSSWSFYTIQEIQCDLWFDRVELWNSISRSSLLVCLSLYTRPSGIAPHWTQYLTLRYTSCPLVAISLVISTWWIRQWLYTLGHLHSWQSLPFPWQHRNEERSIWSFSDWLWTKSIMTGVETEGLTSGRFLFAIVNGFVDTSNRFVLISVFFFVMIWLCVCFSVFLSKYLHKHCFWSV